MSYNIAWNQDGSVAGEELGDLSPEMLSFDRPPSVCQTHTPDRRKQASQHTGDEPFPDSAPVALMHHQLFGPASILKRMSVTQQLVPVRDAYPAGTPTQLVPQAMREGWGSLLGALLPDDVGLAEASVGIAPMLKARTLTKIRAGKGHSRRRHG
ncbi:hypothetical protein CPB85DRAFT_1449913 [Mucidula mucida]|nr:hypothetical protein CPB85DRAFT_1449913 [Mucidula mucida]